MRDMPSGEDGAEHFRKIGIALGGKDREGMADHPEQQPGDPHSQAQAQRRRDRAVDDGDRARRAGQQDRLGQRAVQRHLEAFDHDAPALRRRRRRTTGRSSMRRRRWRARSTIWIRRRKPPAVSPKASVRPVMMMMMTATDLGDRPLNGIEDIAEGAASHGMLVPAAKRCRLVAMLRGSLWQLQRACGFSWNSPWG